MFGGAESTWFQLFAFIVCAALASLAVYSFIRANKVTSPTAWWSFVGAMIFLAVGVLMFYTGETAGTEAPRLLKTEGMTDLNNQASPAPTPVEIKKDFQKKHNEAFGETAKSVADHQKSADEAIDRALERAAKRDNNP